MKRRKSKKEEEWIVTATGEPIDQDSIKLRSLAEKITKVPKYVRRYREEYG